MNKLRPKNKICFQNNNPHAYLIKLKLEKLKKKKWFILKKKMDYPKEIKPEKKNHFFKKRLVEKQQFKNFYGCISEYKLKNLFKKLLKRKNKINIFKYFTSTIESRLDINVLRMQLAKSIFHSKQIINHKKIKVNNKIINKPSYLLKKGDIITIINEN